MYKGESCNVVLHLEDLILLTKGRKVMKLHCQFAHASKERLIYLLKNSRFKDKEFLLKVEKGCNYCQFCTAILNQNQLLLST